MTYFFNNTALCGEAVLVQGCTLTIGVNSLTKFAVNMATVSGGAIYIMDSHIRAGITFFDNKAEFGGALYANTNLKMVLSASFINNVAELCGGAGVVNGKGITPHTCYWKLWFCFLHIYIYIHI